ncbi:MAG: hypothetical protein ABIY40_08745 [Rhodanobacteraceae bacterium]
MCARPALWNCGATRSVAHAAPPWNAAWAPFVYAWPLDRLEARFKFGPDLAASRLPSAL